LALLDGIEDGGYLIFGSKGELQIRGESGEYQAKKMLQKDTMLSIAVSMNSPLQ